MKKIQALIALALLQMASTSSSDYCKLTLKDDDRSNAEDNPNFYIFENTQLRT